MIQDVEAKPDDMGTVCNGVNTCRFCNGKSTKCLSLSLINISAFSSHVIKYEKFLASIMHRLVRDKDLYRNNSSGALRRERFVHCVFCRLIFKIFRFHC